MTDARRLAHARSLLELARPVEAEHLLRDLLAEDRESADVMRELATALHDQGRHQEAVAKRTEGFSGADLAHLCETASERALMDSVASGQRRMITMVDFEGALGEVRRSIGPWLETARNVALYANASGECDKLAVWLRKQHK